jgi:Transcriptional regulator PadR-like family
MARDPSSRKLDILQGTLDLMVLQTLASMGTFHGYGLARRVEQRNGDEVLVNQGTIYASLLRLQQRRWISAKRGVSLESQEISVSFRWAGQWSQSPLTRRVVARGPCAVRYPLSIEGRAGPRRQSTSMSVS